MRGERDGQTTEASDAPPSTGASGAGAAPRLAAEESTFVLSTPPASGAPHPLESNGPSPQADDFPPLLPGESLVGRFRIVRLIAKGGMGVVYEASDTTLRSAVALKVIRSRTGTDVIAMARF